MPDRDRAHSGGTGAERREPVIRAQLRAMAQRASGMPCTHRRIGTSGSRMPAAIAEMINTAYQQPVETCFIEGPATDPRRPARCAIDVDCGLFGAVTINALMYLVTDNHLDETVVASTSAPSCSTGCAAHRRPVMSTYGLSVLGADLKSLAQTAQAADAAGFDAVWASEFYSRSGSISMAAMANSTRTVGSVPPFSTASAEAPGAGHRGARPRRTLQRTTGTRHRQRHQTDDGRLARRARHLRTRPADGRTRDAAAPDMEPAMKGRSITRAVLQNESHPDRRRGILQQADPDRHCRCPAPDVRGGRAGGRRPSRTSAVHNHHVEEVVRPAIARAPRTPAATPMTWKSFPW